MAKHKYTVTFEGHTFTRSTDRTYSHVVLAWDSREDWLERKEDGIAYDIKTNWSFYETEAKADTSRYAPTGTPNSAQEWHERYAARVALGKDGYRALKLQEVAAELEERDAAGYWAKPGVVGWAGRLDLAQKLLGKHSGWKVFSRLEIVAVPAL